MNTPEKYLLDRLELSRKAYQAALIDLRMAEDLSRGEQAPEGGHDLTSARSKLSAATREFQDALKTFTDFALEETGNRCSSAGSE